jgi:hypothetical protein
MSSMYSPFVDSGPADCSASFDVLVREEPDEEEEDDEDDEEEDKDDGNSEGYSE